MKTIIIREDALQVIEDNAIFPLQEQKKAAEGIVKGKKVALYYIEIGNDVENRIKSKGINLDDIDQVSDFILSIANPNH